MKTESIERISTGISLGLIMFAYAIILYMATGGFEATAFVIWVIMSMLTANFYIMINIRNILARQYKLEKEMFEQNNVPQKKNVEITMPIEVGAEEKPTKKRK